MYKFKLAKREANTFDNRFYIWENCPTPKCAGGNINWYSEISIGGTCSRCQGRLPGSKLNDKLQARADYHLGVWNLI